MSEFEHLADTADLPEGALLAVQRSTGEPICLYNHRGAIDDHAGHAAAAPPSSSRGPTRMRPPSTRTG